MNAIRIDGQLAYLTLHQRDGSTMEAVIDATDLPAIIAFGRKWSPTKFGKSWYVQAGLQNPRRTVLLHRFLMAAPPGSLVDHENHNGLDNRRQNMRFADKSQNTLNRNGPRVGSKSGIRGVSWNKTGQSWQASVSVRGKKNYLGLYKDKNEAGTVVQHFLRTNNLIPVEVCHRIL